MCPQQWMLVCPFQNQCYFGKKILFSSCIKKKFKTFNLFDRKKYMYIDWLTTRSAWKLNKNIKFRTVLGGLEMTTNIFFLKMVILSEFAVSDIRTLGYVKL